VGGIHTNGAVLFVSVDPTAAPTAAHGVNFAGSVPLVTIYQTYTKNPPMKTRGFLLFINGGYGYGWLVGK